jgi:hypothetical protein
VAARLSSTQDVLIKNTVLKKNAREHGKTTGNVKNWPVMKITAATSPLVGQIG